MAIRNSRGQLVVTSSRTLHRYTVIGKLGSGGFGDVFRARSIDMGGMLVALKRYKRQQGSTQQTWSNWASEVSTHEALSHPNILQAFDAFEDGGYLYLVTELATKSVDQYIDEYSAALPPWDDTLVARAGMHLASALHYLHVGWNQDRPLLHRDVTPNNVFVFEDTNVFKLGDFGISKLLDEPDGIAVTQIANWGFVSPELVRLGFTVPASDLFQLGLVLYTMSAGRHVVPKDASIDEKKQAIADGAAWRSAKELEYVDYDLQECMKRLLLRDRSKRYGAAKDVHVDLRKIYSRLRNAQRQDP